MFKRILTLALAAVVLIVPTLAQAASTYPSRPVRMVVAYPAGGSTDIAARLLAKALSERLKGSFVVENRGGGGGVIGASVVANAPADGNTLLFAASPELSLAKATKKDVPYDVQKDFAPIAMIGRVPFILVANKNFPPNNVKELIAYAKAHPGAVNFSSFGSGTSNHLAGELMNLQAGIHMTHVPYRGSTPSLTDLMGGQIQVTFDTITAVLPLIKAGNVKALAIATPQRSPLLPNVPTVSESGLPGFTAGTWFALVAPKGTPAPVVKKLSETTIAILHDAQFDQSLDKLGIVADPQPPQVLATFIASETKKWAGVITQIGLKPQ